MSQLKYLNLGCGRVILPAPAPGHYGLLPAGLTDYALWHNVDRNPEPGVDETLDIFRYPWPWPDNSFDGALCAHIVEHIPHEIALSKYAYSRPNHQNEIHRYAEITSNEALSKAERDDAMKMLYAFSVGDSVAEPEPTSRASILASLQDGWYVFMAELHRVLTPDALIHILSPYGWSQGAITDPTHTRLITEQTFTHSMQPDPNSPFKYATGGLNLALDEVRYNITPMFQHLIGHEELLREAFQTRVNVVYELYARLKVVK